MLILDCPTSGASQQLFEIQRNDYSAPEASGRIGGVQAGFPLWVLNWTLGTIGPARTDAWRAFFAQIRGATRRFLGHDLARPYPSAYLTIGFAGMVRAGGGSFDGTATSWSETIDSDGNSNVTLHGLPAAFALGQGDYIGFTWTATDAEVAGLTWHAPVRTVVGAIADGSGNITVKSEPPIPSAVPSGATAYLNTPKCVMALDLSKSQMNPIDRSLGMVAGATIVGVQDIRG